MNKFKIKNSPRNCETISGSGSRKSYGFLGAGLKIRDSIMRSSGFSFIELMTVVAIVAILIGVSMPLFRNFTRGRNLKEGTNMVVFALRKARNAAITERKMYKTTFDTINQAVGISLVVDSSPNNDQLVEKWERLSEFVKFDTTVSWGTDSSWCTGNGGLNRYEKNYDGDEEVFWIQFKTTGAVDGVGFVPQKIVLLEESTGDTKLITVNALTGKIGVE